jgi:glycosyltransferase involved in cell wall biosynthesis
MTRVAVVIPVWNRAATLGRAIESALVQHADEVVVVDDASDDNSVEVARRYPVTVVTRQRKSINHIQDFWPACQTINADYLVGMGADDVLYEGMVASVRDVLDAKKSRGWPGVVFGDYCLLREGSPPEVLGVRRFRMPGVTAMNPPEARAWFQASPATRHECGVGSAIRRDMLMWLHEQEFWRLGPWADSFGYVVAAIKAGCIYVPEVFAGFVVQQSQPSYHQQVLNDQTKKQQFFEEAQAWLSRPGISPFVNNMEFGI